jgi:ubiquinone/menaquinone biosynthesis C-methylase UbiE
VVDTAQGRGYGCFVPGLPDRYAPGFADDAVAMMADRSAGRRAAFLLPLLAAGMRVLDAGCGPGTITSGLASCVEPGGRVVGVDAEASQIELARATAEAAASLHLSFEIGSVYELQFASASFDVAFAHGLFEHLARPLDALAELRRVLRPGGLAAACSSDWSAAAVEPRTADVEAALACHRQLRRQAGGDPDGGGRLPGWIREAGFDVISVEHRDEVDLAYPALAAYVGTRIEEALARAAPADRHALAEGAAAARRWQQHDGVRCTQRWVAVVARRP